MRTSSSEKSEEWKALTANLMKQVINKNITAIDSMTILGDTVRGNVGEKIASITTPALAPSTIKARIGDKKVGNVGTATKPLIHTSYMLDSLASEVTSK